MCSPGNLFSWLHVQNTLVQLEFDELVICSVDFDQLTYFNWYLMGWHGTKKIVSEVIGITFPPKLPQCSSVQNRLNLKQTLAGWGSVADCRTRAAAAGAANNPKMRHKRNLSPTRTKQTETQLPPLTPTHTQEKAVAAIFLLLLLLLSSVPLLRNKLLH